jgi:hypothetical protein
MRKKGGKRVAGKALYVHGKDAREICHEVIAVSKGPIMLDKMATRMRKPRAR